MSRPLFLDIETGPDWAAIDRHWPLGGPPEWDASEVKYGNAKKPELREQIEVKALAEHSRLVRDWGNEAHLDRHRREMLDANKCLLNPCLSQVWAIGRMPSTPTQAGPLTVDIDPVNETEMLRSLALGICQSAGICGWNIKGFDLPYLAMRMRINGIEPPPLMMPLGRYYSDGVIDLMEVCGSYQYGTRYKLKHAAPAFGYDVSPEPDGGAFFWELPRYRQEPYLSWDVTAVEFIYRKIFRGGVV